MTVDRAVAPAALGRAVLLGNGATTLTAGGTGLRLAADPGPPLLAAGTAAAATAAGLTALAWNPYVVRHPVPVLLADTFAVLAVLAADPGIAYFCAAAGASALAGVVLGPRAVLVGAAHAALGYAVAARVLAGAPDHAEFVLAFPIACVLAAAGAAVATAALRRHVELSVRVVASAQRAAAAGERARLARELHDSVAKTLRGVSFAALALPQSLRRHPDLAERLAGTVSAGAAAAAREARDLLDGLRADEPDRDFGDTLADLCARFADRVPVRLDAEPLDPPVAVRYELCRILQEALRNAAGHAAATSVAVRVRGRGGVVELTVDDDGRGFDVPPDPAALRARHHYGILGMTERARSAGGSLRIVSRPGTGTSIRATIPLRTPARA
ncbi:sensor histidine kinase [Dactylosporangium salmoneum]|uniref:Histidine kinase/HSP90-like ATPase domain-containing protein n=1 Tax=Dactylosporangium salmoneum TaxID=53361 RepID=A0ABN3GWG4_9ACTN